MVCLSVCYHSHGQTDWHTDLDFAYISSELHFVSDVSEISDTPCLWSIRCVSGVSDVSRVSETSETHSVSNVSRVSETSETHSVSEVSGVSDVPRVSDTVNQLILAAIKFGGFTTFWVIIGVFPYIILFNFCPNAKSAKFNSTPNLVDLQYIWDT